MKKLLTLFLTLVMTICLVNLNNSHTKAEDPNYLKFTAVKATDVAFVINGTLTTTPSLEYSKNGDPWSSYTFGNSVSLDIGENVRFKAASENTSFSESGANYITFTSTDKINASGNVMSLVDSTCASITIPSDWCFASLFNGCANLVSIEGLELPATTLTTNCYQNMFNGCSSITSIPDLPATNLPNGCYTYMFYECTSLPNGIIQSDGPSGEFTIKYTIPADGQKATGGGTSPFLMFYNVQGFDATPNFGTAAKTYYKKPATPKPEPSPSEPVVKDESCEKVIGPTWHWNNDKGICEEYATVGTSTK